MKKTNTAVLNCRIPEKEKAELEKRAAKRTISAAAMLRIILSKEFALRDVKVS